MPRKRHEHEGNGDEALAEVMGDEPQDARPTQGDPNEATLIPGSGVTLPAHESRAERARQAHQPEMSAELQQARERRAQRKAEIAQRGPIQANAMAEDIVTFLIDYMELKKVAPNWLRVKHATTVALRLLQRRWSTDVLGNVR